MSGANVISIERARARRMQHECGTVVCARCGCSTIVARPPGETGERTTCPVCQYPSASFEPTGFAEMTGGMVPVALRAGARRGR